MRRLTSSWKLPRGTKFPRCRRSCWSSIREYLFSAGKKLPNQRWARNSRESSIYNTTTLPENSDTLSFLPAKPKALSFYEFGYTSDFVNAEFEVLLQILITSFKLAILRLMAMLPFKRLRKLCKQMLKLWDEIILFELIMLAPQLNVITGIFYQSPYLFVLRNFQEMVNLGLIHSCSFLCLIIFLITFINRLDKLKALFVGHRRRKNEEKSKPNKSIKKGNGGKSIALSKQLLKLSDDFLYISVPFLAGYGNTAIFMIAMTVATTIKLQKLIQYRHLFKCAEFCKQLFSKIVWFGFNLVYLGYWLTEVLQINCSKEPWLSVIIVADYAETLILIIGCFCQIAISLLQLLFQLYRYILSPKEPIIQQNPNKGQRNPKRDDEQNIKKDVVIFILDNNTKSDRSGWKINEKLSQIKNMNSVR